MSADFLGQGETGVVMTSLVRASRCKEAYQWSDKLHNAQVVFLFYCIRREGYVKLGVYQPV